MHKMPDPSGLSEEQLRQVTATLQRIREGLVCDNRLIAPEPSHLFTPRIQDAI
ncbi:hypothetical protein [Bradyrhizobium sp. Gha]|uniref:hypothetical protein n=1 Tax=Bradyrhizobium sp. Gha TaxID=1855318 RepID=UPI0008E8DB3D|nr:hypothetical protein [Bradyrhizobium sp. Gha]SFK25570.1 hypothetical protein SAMN05216525_1705 [Bradyrhizobium sp. Gha]